MTLTTLLITSNVFAAECSDVEFHQDVIDKYPTIANACQEVITKDDKSYIKVVADFVSFRRPNKLTINVHENDGSKEKQVIEVEPDMMVMAGNKEVNVASLPRNYQLNFFMPSDRFEFIADEIMIDEPTETMAMLPKTASVWPAIGLAGLTMLGFSQLLAWRRKRT
jgi:LPXTG-motif cell wall-anchored protein